MNRFVVYLRDRSIEPCNFLIEIEKEDADNVLTEWSSGTLALAEFARQAELVTPPHDNVDVYIGWWGDQDTFNIPKEFFELIAKRGWKVTFDIND